MHPDRLAPFVAAHILGIAEQNPADLAIFDHLLENLQIGALVGAHQIRQALRCNPQGIADGEPDAFLAEIQGEDAWPGGSQINFIIDGAMLQSRQGLAVASITKSPSLAQAAVQEVRHLSLPIIALGVIIAILYFGRVFFITAMTAVTIAFILEPFVTVMMRLHLPRSVASFVVCTLALLFLYVIGMGAYTQLTGLYGDLPKYGQRIADMVDNVQQRIQNVESDTYRMLVPTRQREEEERQRQAASKRSKSSKALPAPTVIAAPAPPAAPPESAISAYIADHLSSFYQILLMVSFVPFLVYFMLSWRDHINRSFLQLFHGEARVVAARSLQGIAEMVRAFVVGNFLLGFLLAIVSSAMFYAIGCRTRSWWVR